MSLWIATPDQIAAIDRAIFEELRKQMISEGHMDEDGNWPESSPSRITQDKESA